MYTNIMKNTISNANDKGVYVDGDYYAPCFNDEPKLEVLYCGQCKCRKEFYPYIPTVPYPDNEVAIKAHRKYFMDDGKPYKVAVACKCQQDQRQKAEKAAMLKKIAFERKKECWGYVGDSGLIVCNKDMEMITFDKYKTNKHILKALGYVNTFGIRQKEGKGLILCGKSGAGKTIAAMCMANALLDKGVEVYFKQQFEITTISQFNEKKQFERLQSCKVLIIDDINPDIMNDYASEIIFNLFETRIKRHLITCFTSNMRQAALEHPKKPSDKRLFDRILSNCYICEDSSNNYRREVKANNL